MNEASYKEGLIKGRALPRLNPAQQANLMYATGLEARTIVGQFDADPTSLIKKLGHTPDAFMAAINTPYPVEAWNELSNSGADHSMLTYGGRTQPGAVAPPAPVAAAAPPAPVAAARPPAPVAAAAPRSPAMVQPVAAPLGGPPVAPRPGGASISARRRAAEGDAVVTARRKAAEGHADASIEAGMKKLRAQRGGGSRPGIAPVPSPTPIASNGGVNAGGRSLAAELFGYGTGGQLSQTYGEIKGLAEGRLAYGKERLQPLRSSLAEARAAKTGVDEAKSALRQAKQAAPSFWGEGAKSLGNFFGASDLPGAGGLRVGAGAARIGAAVFGAGLAMKGIGAAADWIFD